MITKNNIVTGIVCGGICVVFMWVYMTFFMYMGMNYHSQGMNNSGMHKMPNGEMMMNDGSMMNMADMTMNDMVNDLKGKKGRDLEKAFLNGMIPHHQGAVDMAKILLQDKTVRPEFVKFANEIISAQEKEIQMQNTWLQTMFK